MTRHLCPICHEEKCQHIPGYAVHPDKLHGGTNGDVAEIMIMIDELNRILLCFTFELLQHALEHLHDEDGVANDWGLTRGPVGVGAS